MRKVLLGLMLMVASVALGQRAFEIRGVIMDTEGQGLPGVSIKVLHGNDSAFSVTANSGSFSLTNISNDSFVLIATHTGLQTFTQTYKRSAKNAVFHVEPILLSPAIDEMEAIIIQSVKPVIVKEDTVQYAAAAYKVREGAAVGEVIKKLPGVTVDEDGNVETQGKQVAHIRVNGKDFFGGDVQTVLEELPADIVDNIQLIDDYGDQANITGVKSGEPRKIININIQKSKNRGTNARFTAAAGNEGRFLGNTFINNFLDERQVSFRGTVGNTSANMSGSRRGGGDEGGSSGVTLSKSAGINFRNKWGNKLTVYGSYDFSSRTSKTENSSFSQDFNPKNIRITQRESQNHNKGTNHRLNWNMEYAIDDQNYLKVSPYLSYGSTDNESRSRSEISRPGYYTLNNNSTSNKSHSPNFGGSMLFNHKFKKKGRNFSIHASINYSENERDRYSNNLYNKIDSASLPLVMSDTMQLQNTGTDNLSLRTNVRLAYMEPLNKARNTFLEISHQWNRSANESIKDVYDLLDSTGKEMRYNERQSDSYNYQFETNRTGISIRGRKEKYNYSVGIQSQPLVLSGTSISKKYSTTYRNINWIPSARFVYNFSRNNSLTATIDGSAREPGFFQLQPVTDSSNLENIVIGNSELKNEFTNRYAIRYNRSNNKGSSLFFNFSYDKTQDKIVSSRMNNPTGTGRSTSYVNTDGFYGYSGDASFTQPFSNRKFSVSVGMRANYDNNISFTDGFKNKGQNLNLRPNLVFRMDINEVVDLSFRSSFTYYQTSTRYATHTTSNEAQTLRLGLDGKNYFGDLTVGYNFTKSINYNFSKSVKDNPSILNLYAEYRFFKKKNVNVRMQAYDLFNKYTGLTRTVHETTITDSRSSRLGRLFLLSVNVRLNKYGGTKAGNNRPSNHNMHRARN